MAKIHAAYLTAGIGLGTFHTSGRSEDGSAKDYLGLVTRATSSRAYGRNLCIVQGLREIALLIRKGRLECRSRY